MKLNAHEIEKEKTYLEKTKEIIKSEIKEKEQRVSFYKDDIIKNKKFIWQNIHEMTDAEMYNAMDEEDLNVDLINKDIVKSYKLYRSLDNPYFGKVVFNGEEIYLGITGVEKDKTYVYDWRAPISNLYYNFERGTAFFDVHGERCEGTITQKRHFKIELGEMKVCYDNDIQIDDEFLEEVLIESHDEKMTNIVNTIQKEQNEIIRYSSNKNVIIDGAPGGGKTSIALHRIAYLIYKEKDLTENNILIFSPNDIFIDYISNVLPELGENNAKTTTMSDFAKSYIKSSNIESLSNFIERYYDGKIELCDIDDIKHKTGENFKRELDNYIENFINDIHFTKSIGLKKIMVSSTKLNEMFHNSLRKLSLRDRIESLSEKLCDRFDIDVDKNLEKMTKTIKRVLKLKLDALSLYEDFLGGNFDKDNIKYEDIYGILYLYFELNGYPVSSEIKHVVIDEVQDYSYIELSLIKNIFKGAKFTILGDKNQIINPFIKYHSLDEIGEIFPNTKLFELKKAYRSSKEIVTYSNRILNIEDVVPVRKNSGEEVLFKTEENLEKDILEDLYRFKEKNYKRVGIITKNSTEAMHLYSALKKYKNVSLITDTILKDVVILPSYLSKGLEFDAVISYNQKDNPYIEDEKYLYYVVVTRARSGLVIYNQK